MAGESAAETGPAERELLPAVFSSSTAEDTNEKVETGASPAGEEESAGTAEESSTLERVGDSEDWVASVGSGDRISRTVSTPSQDRKLSGEALSGKALSDEVRREEALSGEVLSGEALRGEALPGEVLSGEVLSGEALSAEEFSVPLCPSDSWILGSKTDLLRDSTRELPARNRRIAKAAESTGMKNEGLWTPLFSADEGTALPDLRTALPDLPLSVLFWSVLILPLVFWLALFMAVLF